MADEIVKIYSLKVGNEQRKAMDLVSLNAFMDKRILDSNPIFMEGIDGMTIGEYRSVLYSRVLLELSKEVKIQLGILERPKEPQQPQNKQEQIVEQDDEPEDEEPVEQDTRKIPVPPRKKEAKQEVEEMLRRNSGDDDIVVLE